MVRGINKQAIFLASDEKKEYLRRLSNLKQQLSIELLSFCIMDNHAHLLLFEPNDDTSLSKLMLRLNSGYAGWYNRRHGRIGPLFQDRFCSEVIQSDSQLLAVVRYIHQNPMKIGRSVAHWTSYHDYLNGTGITDTVFVLSMFDESPERARQAFADFVTREKEEYPDFVNSIEPTKTDRQALELIESVVGQNRARTLIRLDKKQRNDQLRKLKDKGLTVRQLESATGISRSVIARA